MTAKGLQFLLGVIDNTVLKLTVVIAAQLVTILQNYLTVPFKWVSYKECELYLIRKGRQPQEKTTRGPWESSHPQGNGTQPR